MKPLITAMTIASNVAVLAQMAPQRTTDPGPVKSLHQVRVEKCEYIVKRLYPKSGFLPYVEYFITAHEKRGMGEEWWWSLVYGGANIELRCNYRHRNGCAGPMDRPGGSTNVKKNIDAHCNEMKHYRTNMRQGYKLIMKVFYPARPHDWGSRRMWRRHLRHKECIRGYYERLQHENP